MPSLTHPATDRKQHGKHQIGKLRVEAIGDKKLQERDVRYVTTQMLCRMMMNGWEWRGWEGVCVTRLTSRTLFSLDDTLMCACRRQLHLQGAKEPRMVFRVFKRESVVIQDTRGHVQKLTCCYKLGARRDERDVAQRVSRREGSHHEATRSKGKQSRSTQ